MDSKHPGAGGELPREISRGEIEIGGFKLEVVKLSQAKPAAAIALALVGCVPSNPPIREVTLADGSIIYAKCGVDYAGVQPVVADTMPPGTPCLDWEMQRARMEPHT